MILQSFSKGRYIRCFLLLISFDFILCQSPHQYHSEDITSLENEIVPSDTVLKQELVSEKPIKPIEQPNKSDDGTIERLKRLNAQLDELILLPIKQKFAMINLFEKIMTEQNQIKNADIEKTKLIKDLIDRNDKKIDLLKIMLRYEGAPPDIPSDNPNDRSKE